MDSVFSMIVMQPKQNFWCFQEFPKKYELKTRVKNKTQLKLWYFGFITKPSSDRNVEFIRCRYISAILII